MLQGFKIPISWFELGKRTANATIEDDVSGLAAQLAYYFFLALFPALLFLVALASFFPVHDLMNQIVGALARFAPGEVLTIVRDQITKIAGARHTGLLTIGFLGTVWSTSSAISGIISTLNQAYSIKDSRPWWKVRLISIALTFGVGIFLLVSFALVLVGPMLAGPIANWVGLGHAFEITWRIIQWPIVFLLVTTAIGMIYYFGPDAEQHWEWITPGSLLATILWILVSLGFRVYLSAFGNFNATYGTIGGIIVAMLWLYISGIAILVGAELNAEIEHASPWGKDPGEKKPGELRRLGRAAAAAYAKIHPHGPEQGSDRPAREPGVAVPAPRPGRMLPGLSPNPAVSFTAATETTTAASETPPPTSHVGPTPSAASPAGPPRRRVSDRLRLSDWVLGGAAIVAELAMVVRSMTRKVRG